MEPAVPLMYPGRLTEIDADLPDTPEDEPARAPLAPRLRWLEIVLGALACWVAALAFRPAFASFRSFAVPTVAAATGAAIVAVLGRRRAVALRWALAASAVVAALFTSYTVLVGTLAGGVVPGQATLSGLRRGLGDGFADLLDGSLPLRDDTFGLVFVTLATWACVAITIELVQRTRPASLPVVPAVALLGLAMPVVAPTHPPSSWHLSALIAVALLLVLVRAVPDPRATGTVIGPRVDGLAEFHSRSLLSARLSLGLPLILVVAVLAPLAGGAISARRPADPRELRREVVETVRVADPLGEYKRIVNQSPARPAFQVRIEGAGAAEVARAAIVRLDAYDGVRFGTTDRYGEPSSTLIAAEDRPVAGRDITLRFSNLDLEYPWLPTAGTPLRTDLRGVGYSPDSGDLLAPGSVKGLGYEVRSRLVLPTLADLSAAGVDSTPGSDRYRALPGGLPPSLGRVASEATQGAVGAAETLDRLATYLRTNYALDTSAPAGHSAGRLEQFLRVDRRGSPEQFAAAFAVMARTLGYPTRVVVGYKLTTEDNGSVRPLEFVTSASYHAWVEVRFDDLGWTPFDPSPAPGATPPTPARDPAAGADTVTPSGGTEQRTPREIGPSEADLAEDDAPGWLRQVLLAFALVGGVAGLLALLAGSVLAGKALRRRRRAAGPRPADRIVGAWDEVVDRLVELRLPITASMTPRDIASTTREIYGTAATLPLSFLVPDVGRAVFGATEPDDTVADRAWERAREFEQNLAITLNRRQRWQARLSLRPLRAPRTEDVPTTLPTPVDATA